MSYVIIILLCFAASTIAKIDEGIQSKTDECTHNLNRQSPIAIDSEIVELCPENVGLFDLSHYDKVMEFEAINTGHSVDFHPPEGTIEIWDGGLVGNYSLVQFHFHWGSHEGGAEHVIDGEAYSLEVHLVHSGGAQTEQNRSLAVIAVLFKIGERNVFLDKLLKVFDKIKYPDHNKAFVPRVRLSDLLPEERMFYRHHGSLTTPPCSETVVWSVMTEILEISSDQLGTFRSLLDSHQHHIQYNNRDIQELGNRTIHCCGCEDIELMKDSKKDALKTTSDVKAIAISSTKAQQNVAGNKSLAVVAVLFESGDENPALEKLLIVFDDITIPGDTDHPTVPDFALIDLLPEGKQYYRYMGSLTTPPCTETVVWTVMHETRQVSHEQLDKFRTLLDPSQNHIQDNYRDLQQIGNRHVFCCGCHTISAAQNLQAGKSWYLACFSVMIFVIGSLAT